MQFTKIFLEIENLVQRRIIIKCLKILSINLSASTHHEQNFMKNLTHYNNIVTIDMII